MPVMRSMALNTASTGPSPRRGLAHDGAVLVPQARPTADGIVAEPALQVTASSVHSAGPVWICDLGQRLDVGVVDHLLAVGQRLEAVEDLLQLVLVEVVAQVEHALPQGVPAAVLAQHQFGLRQADVLGVHDLVGRAAP